MGEPSLCVGIMRCLGAVMPPFHDAGPCRGASDHGASAIAKGVAAVVLCLLGAAGAAEELFAAAPAPAAAAPSAGQSLPAKRSRWVWLDTARLAGLAPPPAGQPDGAGASPSLTLNLFDDARFEALVERRSPALSGHLLRGKLVGQPGRWTLVVRGGGARGTVLTPNRAFTVTTGADGRHQVAEVDRSLFPPDDPDAEWRVRLPPDPVGPPPRQESDRPPVGPRHRSLPPPLLVRPQDEGLGLPSAGGRWRPIGPAPIHFGQVENVGHDDEVVGAIHTVLAHPTNANVLFIGAVNGGVWRTDNATSPVPTWRPLTDDFPSLSIGAMAMDLTDPNTILAGIGRYSSYSLFGGDRRGLFLTEDGGATWRHIDLPYGGIVSKNVTGVAVAGDRLIASLGPWELAVYRSLDGGATWMPGAGLPNTGAFDLVVDPTDRNRLYVTMRERGVFLSQDGGASWRDVSSHDRAVKAAFTEIVKDPEGDEEGSNNNAEMAVAQDGRLYVAVLAAGQAQYIGFTDDQGGTWTAMDLPRTPECDGTVAGLNPRFKPGGQGAIHFSILADPTDPNIVYVGGDRQDLRLADDGSDCNFIGATDYSGRLFRGNTAVAPTDGVPSPQWEHLTHSNAIREIPGGGTASASAPHADSREMVFDARGDIVQVDDGGIYRRTSPRDNTGDWFSLNGTLQVTEMHDVAYDPLGEVVIGGNQDTGTAEQPAPDSREWDTVEAADGGDVAVDASNAPDYSIRYSSYQYLIQLRRILYNEANEVIEYQFPGLALDGVSAYELFPEFRFVQPTILNAVASGRGVLPAASLYETHDRFSTLTEVHAFGSDEGATTAAFGCASNPDLLYVGYEGSPSGLLRRTRAGAGLRRTGYRGEAPRAILINPDDCDTVYVADVTDVYVSHDTGAQWTPITGNLVDVPVLWRDHRSLQFVSSAWPLGAAAVLVGGHGGVHVMLTAEEGVWRSMNEGLPGAPVWDMDYHAADQALVVSTLGRGAWRLQAGPVAVRRIEDVALEVADGARSVRLAGVFRDLAGGRLTYAVESADDAIAEARVVGDVITITPRAAGAVLIHVSARNAAGVAAPTTRFAVTVGAVLNIAGPAAAAEGESARLTLTLSRALDAEVEVRYEVVDDGGLNVDADGMPDYAVTEGAIMVPAGVLEAAFDVPINDDEVLEPWRETFTVTLPAPARNPDYGLGFTNEATVTVEEGVCDNTAAVRDAVVEALGVATCSAVDDPVHVSTLDVSRRDIGRLKAGEFFHFSWLRSLDLSGNRLTAVPADAFPPILQTLRLGLNRLETLPDDQFGLAPSLRELHLDGNRLTALPPTLFRETALLKVIHLGGNRLAALPPTLFRDTPLLEEIHLQANALAELPTGIFQGLGQLNTLRLEDNPGSPFAFVLELMRDDAVPWSPRSPATVFLALRQGAPYTMFPLLTVDDRPASSHIDLKIDAGSQESTLAQVHRAQGQAALVRVVAPSLPNFRYSGFQMVPGEPLLLFKARPRVVSAPPPQTLEADGEAIVIDLDDVFGDFDSAELTYAATSNDEALATVSIEGSSLTITPTDAEGVLTVTVTATDPDGLSATLVIQVAVEPLSRGLPSWRLVPLEED